MKISILQADILWNDTNSNFKRYIELFEEAQKAKPDLVLLPEMFSTGFSFLKGDSAVEADLRSTEFLTQAANQYNFTIAASMPDTSLSAEKPRNTIKIFSPTGLLASYSKVHLFSFAGEDQHYQAGDRELNIKLEDVGFSFFICYDLRFPEFFSRQAKNSEVFVVLANWPNVRRAHWETLLCARAIENQAYVVGVNRVGQGGQLFYDGASQVIAPSGDIIAHAGSSINVLSVELDLPQLRKYRQDFPVLKDRKESLYESIK